MRRRAVLCFLSVAGSIGFMVLFRLSWPGGLILCLVSIGLLPLFERNRKCAQKESVEYGELTLYMEQVLCSYRRWKKLGCAWEDCLLLYEKDSRMRKAIANALHCLKTGGDADNIWHACRCIHKEYKSERLVLLHEFLCRAEKMGGDTGEALNILLEDLQLWKRRKSLFRARKKIMKAESVLAVFFGCCMCGFSILIMPVDLERQLIASTWYQISSIAVICFLLLTLLKISNKFDRTWPDTARMERGRTRGQKKQYAILKSGSHGLKWHIARKYCRQEVERVFSYWMLSVTLFMQQENVYQALMDSLGQLHGMFREEVSLLIRNIYESPSSFHPYLDFFKELQMEEIQTGMKLLYAAGNNEYEDVSREIHVLVEQNNLVMDKFEQNRQDIQTAGFGLWKQIPLILASLKVLGDMAVLLFMTMEQYSFW